MAVDYRQLLAELLKERTECVRRRDAAQREVSKLAAVIRATVRMLPRQYAPIGERALEEIDERPVGLTEAIRLALTLDDDNEWLTPVEIREALGRLGCSFESYRTNPLVSIHAILKRLVPDQVETKVRADGQKIYRLKATRMVPSLPIPLGAKAIGLKSLADRLKTHGTSGGNDGSPRKS
jgi:hypothetical protein